MNNHKRPRWRTYSCIFFALFAILSFGLCAWFIVDGLNLRVAAVFGFGTLIALVVALFLWSDQ